MKRFIAAGFASFTLVGVLTGCTSSAENSDPAAAAAADDSMRADAITSFATVTGMLTTNSTSPDPQPFPQSVEEFTGAAQLVSTQDTITDYVLAPLNAEGTETDPQKTELCISIGRRDGATNGTQDGWVIWLNSTGAKSTLVPGVISCDAAKTDATSDTPSPEGWNGDKEDFLRWMNTIPVDTLTPFGSAVKLSPIDAVDALATGTPPLVIATDEWVPATDPEPEPAPAPEPPKKKKKKKN